MGQGELVKVGKEGCGEAFDRAAITMAVAVVFKRICDLPREDLQELYELAMELPKAQDDEEKEAIRVAMLEIMDQKKEGLHGLELRGRPADSQKWVDYISKRVRDLRKEAGLTQEELANKSGLPQSHISRIESGKLSPSRTTLEKIASALGRAISDLDPSA